jgi:hypothetical protein
MEWTVNGTLQLQRLAHEELGYGTWRDCDKEVPIPILGDEELAVLDMADVEHPRLRGKLMRNFSPKLGYMSENDEEPDSAIEIPKSETQDWFKGLKRWDTGSTLADEEMLTTEKTGPEITNR